MRLTFHLVPAETWAGLPPDADYRPASLESEGFVHCTDGAAELVATADRHYRTDPRSFVVLTIDLDAVAAPWRFDGDTRFPHIYGPVPRASVVTVGSIQRAPDGRFVRFDP